MNQDSPPRQALPTRRLQILFVLAHASHLLHVAPSFEIKLVAGPTVHLLEHVPGRDPGHHVRGVLPRPNLSAGNACKDTKITTASNPASLSRKRSASRNSTQVVSSAAIAEGRRITTSPPASQFLGSRQDQIAKSAASNARPYSIALLLVCASVWQLVRWKDAQRARHMIGFVLSAAAIPYFHYLFATMYLVFLICAVYEYRVQSRVRAGRLI